MNEQIKKKVGNFAPKIESHAYWLTGYVSPDHISCADALAVVPNFTYAQEILAYLQEQGISHPNITLFESCGKFTETELIHNYIESYGLLLGGGSITDSSDVDYQIHDWTVHFFASLVMSPQKFEAMHEFISQLSQIILTISERYPTRDSVVSTPIKDKTANTLYANGSLSSACLGSLIDNLLSVFWAFEAQSLATCVHRRHPFLLEEQLLTEQLFDERTHAGIDRPRDEYNAPNLACISDATKHVDFIVRYLFTYKGEPIFQNSPLSVDEICERLRPSFSQAFSGGYMNLSTSERIREMHQQFVASKSGLHLTFSGYTPEPREVKQERKKVQAQAQAQAQFMFLLSLLQNMR